MVSHDVLKYCRNINAVAARVIREHAERERTRQLLRNNEVVAAEVAPEPDTAAATATDVAPERWAAWLLVD